MSIPNHCKRLQNAPSNLVLLQSPISNLQLIYHSRTSQLSSFPIFTQSCKPTNQEEPSVEFSCEREIDPVTGLLSAHLSWSYKYDPLTEEGIKRRRLFIPLLGDEKSMPSDAIYIYKEVAKMCETMSYFNFVYILQQNVSDFEGNIICAVVGVDTVKYNQTIAVCLTTHGEYNSQSTYLFYHRMAWSLKALSLMISVLMAPII